MEYALFGVIGVVAVVAFAAFSAKLGIAAPLLLVVVGIGYSFIPGVPQVKLPPEIVLMGLLPPLLYSAAITVPIVDFRRNFGTITALSVVLVIVSAFATGTVLYSIFPDLSYAAAIAIGAVISPPDVVAATAIGRRLGLPPRLLTILEGEGLVNDATALVLLRTAIAATAVEVTFGAAVLDFLYAAATAVAIGLAVGIVTVFVRAKLRDPVLDTAVSFVVPFLAFIPAEAANASGVIAVVTAGLYSGHQSAARFTARSRINERLNWRTVQFVLENGVFFLMGAQIVFVTEEVIEDGESITDAIGLGLLSTAILIGVRVLFMGPVLLRLRLRGEFAERRNLRFSAAVNRIRHIGDSSARSTRRLRRAERIERRRTVDLKSLRSEGLGWRGGVVLSWAGMRGVVTLAAAQSLPVDTPYRAQLVLIAFTVAIVTLLVQGGTLPVLIRLSGVRGNDRTADRRELASLLDDIGKAGVGALENPDFELPNGQKVDPDLVERVRQDTMIGAASAWERADNGGGEDGIADSPHQQYRALRLEVLQAERDALLEARSDGVYASRILQRAQAMLDLEETRLQQIDDPSGAS